MSCCIGIREELFENPDAGASTDAPKVLVLFTDGEPSDSDFDGIIEKYDKKKITRFVIAVSCCIINVLTMVFSLTGAMTSICSFIYVSKHVGTSLWD